MVKFDDGEMNALVKRKRTVDGVAYLIFGILLFAAVIAAVLSKNAYENYPGADWSLYLAALIVALIFLVCLVLHLVFFVGRTNAAVKYAVSERICGAFYADGEILKGGEIKLYVTYEDDVFTVGRADGKKPGEPAPVIVTGNGIKNAAANQSRVSFDVSALKNAFHGAFGTWVLQFLQGYFYVRGKSSGVKSVIITDATGKTPQDFPVYDENVPVKGADKNYFIKKGLIK